MLNKIKNHIFRLRLFLAVRLFNDILIKAENVGYKNGLKDGEVIGYKKGFFDNKNGGLHINQHGIFLKQEQN